MNFYSQSFDTVELNNSFYKMPSLKAFETWRDQTPAGFIFSVKAGRYITHMKKLKDPAEPVQRFMDRVVGLGDKLGPILFQLPPGWNVNVERFHEFLKVLPRDLRYTFEFRNESWYCDEIYDLLREYNCAFCIYELAGHLTPIMVTGDFVYIRLHGPGEKYQGSYDEARLNKWQARVDEWRSSGKDVYIYFDNDQEGFAAFNAKQLKEMSEKS
jgi:uncharacterized protein YecE (DUF72 family)